MVQKAEALKMLGLLDANECRLFDEHPIQQCTATSSSTLPPKSDSQYLSGSITPRQKFMIGNHKVAVRNTFLEVQEDSSDDDDDSDARSLSSTRSFRSSTSSQRSLSVPASWSYY